MSGLVYETCFELCEARSLTELEAAMRRCAPRFHQVLRSRRNLEGFWPELGIQVEAMKSGVSGLTLPRSGRTRVLINLDSQSRRRRWTLAHELGHVLLGRVDKRALDLGRAKEEELCNEFARLALLPPAMVDAWIFEHGFPTSPTAVRMFCDDFRVTLRAGLNGLARHTDPLSPTVLLLASWRPHKKRPRELGFRVDRALSAKHLFFPPDQRLQSMGFGALAAWAESARPGAETECDDARVVIPARRRGVAVYMGPVVSRAVLLSSVGSSAADELSVLAVVDTSGLWSSAVAPTRSAPRRRRPQAAAQQIPLEL